MPVDARCRERAKGAEIGMDHMTCRPPLHALDAAFTELNQVDRLLSIYRADNQVFRLNRNGARAASLVARSTARGTTNGERGCCHRPTLWGSVPAGEKRKTSADG